MDRVTGVVVGAGVVGLAVARALQINLGGDWLILEQENAIGTQTSSRNSEVIHAGIYYPKGSLKAQLCVQGKKMLYTYLQERGLPFKRCGKLIVATHDEQLNQLLAIQKKAADNGVNDMVLLDAQQACELEPQLFCKAALVSPSTGIVDSHALMLSYQGDFENAGGVVVFYASVNRVLPTDHGFELTMQDNTCIASQYLINATGLSAPLLAQLIEGYASSFAPTPYYAKGNYFTLSRKSPFQHLIYPVPEAAGLGVHLTLDLGNQAKFGPDVQWVDDPHDLEVDLSRGDAFYAEVRKYWPTLPDGALEPGYAGIRPKISGPKDASADFLIQGPQTHGVAGLVHLFGIESPGLTSSLAIGDAVLQLLND